MKLENFTEAVKKFFVKLGKRNLIVICAVLLVGAAVAVNWAVIANRSDAAKGKDIPSGQQGDDTAAGADNNADRDSYFSAAQVSRQRARDEALEVLQSVIDDENADRESKEAAIADMTKLAQDMESESKIETLIKSKGFEQCVAVIGTGNVSVVVDTGAEPLNSARIAQINTIVYEQIGVKPENVFIIEK